MATLAATVHAAVQPGEVIPLSWVSSREVDIAVHRRALAHVRRLAYIAGLERIRLRYFGPADERGGDFTFCATDAGEVPLGVTPDDQPGTIAIHYRIPRDLVPWVIAHEFGHLLERVTGTRLGERGCDRLADAYVRGDL